MASGGYVALFLVPLLSLGAYGYVMLQPDSVKTEKGLAAFANRASGNASGREENNPTPLYYLGSPPPSARFYAREKAAKLSKGHLY
ncbi:hypothetical protein [Thiolapillus sp.]|uniref:hypothetical protein n=2 Tax=Thiolapillus sp. TaxID=2017437 RepID=UPI0025F4BFB8|nr:hypothetical protein [Thiolapillus sp.]